MDLLDQLELLVREDQLVQLVHQVKEANRENEVQLDQPDPVVNLVLEDLRYEKFFSRFI